MEKGTFVLVRARGAGVHFGKFAGKSDGDYILRMLSGCGAGKELYPSPKSQIKG